MRNKLAVKICGKNSQTAIDAAIAGGVDYLGFVFFCKNFLILFHDQKAQTKQLAFKQRGLHNF